MANKVILIQQIRALINLLEKGMSFRAIAAELGLSMQPVTLHAASHFICSQA
jgi:DNA-binding NarL/FixJ family response regulator